MFNNLEKERYVRDPFAPHQFRLQEAPKELRLVAEYIMTVCLEVGVAGTGWEYKTATQLDRELALKYWLIINRLQFPLDCGAFKKWLGTAPSMDLISRARRWLVQKKYCYLKDGVGENAQNAAKKWRANLK